MDENLIVNKGVLSGQGDVKADTDSLEYGAVSMEALEGIPELCESIIHDDIGMNDVAKYQKHSKRSNYIVRYVPFDCWKIDLVNSCISVHKIIQASGLPSLMLSSHHLSIVRTRTLVENTVDQGMRVRQQF